jgi:hypothetical protein
MLKAHGFIAAYFLWFDPLRGLRLAAIPARKKRLREPEQGAGKPAFASLKNRTIISSGQAALWPGLMAF